MKPGIKKQVRLLITNNQQKGKKKQNGIALLVLVIIIALTLSAYYFSSISVVEIQVDNIEKTQKTLKQAKQALLAYAMNYRGTAAGLGNPLQGPGNFPCPDDDFDGISDTAVGVVVPGCNSLGPGTMGRYPWATVQTEEFKDANGELLWYALSSNFANQADREINTETTGGINIRNTDGTTRYDGTTNDAIVAVILSPGKTFVRNDGFVQSRSTALERDDPRNYLDIAFGEDNANFTNSSTDGFIAGTIRDDVTNNVIVNDLMVVITYEEIMNLVRAHVTNEVSNLLNDYFIACDAYPEASAFDPMKASFDSAGFAPPVGSELRQGHLPLGIAMPVDWGGVCDAGPPVVLAPVPPLWLAAERWDETTYYTFAYQNAPPANGLTCGNGANPPCMTVINTNPPINNAQALIVFVGRELPAQDRITVPLLASDFLEGENAINNGIFDANETEDYIRVVTP